MALQATDTTVLQHWTRAGMKLTVSLHTVPKIEGFPIADGLYLITTGPVKIWRARPGDRDQELVSASSSIAATPRNAGYCASTT